MNGHRHYVEQLHKTTPAQSPITHIIVAILTSKTRVNEVMIIRIHT